MCMCMDRLERKVAITEAIDENKTITCFAGPLDDNGEEEYVELVNLAPKGSVYYYCKDKILGEGGYGRVLKGFATKRKKKIPVAIKICQLNDVNEFYKDEEFGDVPKEVFILNDLPKHPAAIKFLHYQKISPKTYVIIMERPERCTNLHDIRRLRCFPFSEKRARKIFRNLCRLLREMEGKRLVHGDIKPQNLVYDLDNDVVKLVDFGSACYFEEGKPFDQFHGTDSYMPPEFLLNGTYEASQGTVWTLGILMYYLVTGCRPYQDAVQAVNQPYGPPTHLKDFSPDSRDLVEGMLSVDPNKRLSLRQVLNHPWITGRRISSISNSFHMSFRFSKKIKKHHVVSPL